MKKKNLILSITLLCGLTFSHSDNVHDDITGHSCETHRGCTCSEELSCDAYTLKAGTISRKNYCANDMGIGAEGTQRGKMRKSKAHPTARMIDLGRNPRLLHSSKQSHIHRSPIFVAPKASYRLMLIGRLTI